MNDNNDFVTFVFMVLFGNHRLLFWSFGIVPRAAPSGKILRPKQQPLISKQNHEKMLRSHYSLIMRMLLDGWSHYNMKICTLG